MRFALFTLLGVKVQSGLNDGLETGNAFEGLQVFERPNGCFLILDVVNALVAGCGTTKLFVKSITTPMLQT
ncbi:MAG: hypothetical protein ACK4K3_14245 [Aquabacterium sp.]